MHIVAIRCKNPCQRKFILCDFLNFVVISVAYHWQCRVPPHVSLSEVSLRLLNCAAHHTHLSTEINCLHHASMSTGFCLHAAAQNR